MARKRGRRRGGKNAAAKTVTNVIRQNALNQGGGANSYQDRGALQSSPARWSRNPYYLVSHLERAREYVHLFNTSWEAQKVITIPVDDAFKHRASLKGISEEDAKAIWHVYDDMDLDKQNRRALMQKRLLGGCVAFGVFKLGVDPTTQSLGQPLRLQDIRKGDFEALNVFDVSMLSLVADTHNPFSAEWDRQGEYRVNGIYVHPTRTVVLDGEPLMNRKTRPTFERGRGTGLGFADSKLSVLYDLLRMNYGTQEGAFHLINLASCLIVKAEHLRSMQATNSQAYAALEAICEQISIYRGAVAEGKGVEISQHAASFGAVPELMMMYMQFLAAASDIAATRYIGQSPGGLNATGDSDLQNYYNMVQSSIQNKELRRLQLTEFDWIGCSLWGFDGWMSKRAPFEIEYPDLWNETGQEKAERMTLYANGLTQLVTSGIISGKAAIMELKKRDYFLTDVEAEEMLAPPTLERAPIDPDAAIDRLASLATAKG